MESSSSTSRMFMGFTVARCRLRIGRVLRIFTQGGPNSKDALVTLSLMRRRTVALALAAVLLTVLCGAAAIAANVGILHATETQPVGRYVPFTPRPAAHVPVSSSSVVTRRATTTVRGTARSGGGPGGSTGGRATSSASNGSGGSSTPSNGPTAVSAGSTPATSRPSTGSNPVTGGASEPTKPTVTEVTDPPEPVQTHDD